MDFHDSLKIKMHEYVKGVYRVTKNFPKDELYGVVSQLRRSALSVILNYIEGYARRSGKNIKMYENFLETSYGSLKESKYLLFFSYSENYLNKENYLLLLSLSEEIGKMVWKTLENLSKNNAS